MTTPQTFSGKESAGLATIILVSILLVYLLPGNLLIGNLTAPALQGLILALYVSMRIDARVSENAIIVALGFAVSMTLLTAIALMIDFQRSIYRDYMELGKYGLIAIAFVAGTIMAKVDGIDRILSSACLLAALCFTTVGLTEAVGGGTGGAIKSLYGRELDVLQGKPIISFWTTYYAASIYAFLASILIASIATTKTGILTHVAVLLLMIMILLTQSRSGLLALGALLTIYLLVLIRSQKYIALILIILISAIIVVTSMMLWHDLISERFHYLWYGVKNYFFSFTEHMDGQNSLGYRVSQIRWAVENNSNILIGMGIGKSFKPYLESFVALYYYRYGVLGILLYITIWGWPLAHLICSWIKRRKLASTTVVGVGIFSALLPVLSLSSVVTDQIHCLFVYYVALGLWLGLVLEQQWKQPAEKGN